MNNNSWKWNITVAHPLPTGNNSHSARLIIHSYLIKCWWKSPRARDYAAHMAKTFLSKLDTAGAFGTMCNQSYRNALRELSLSLALWESTDSMSNLRKYHLDRKLCFYFLLETQNIYIYICMYLASPWIHIHGTILFPKLVSTYAYLRVLFMKYVAVSIASTW